MRHRNKFREDRSNRSGDMADFRLFNSGFWKFQIFNGWDAKEGRTASACQILSKSLKPRLRYGDFSIFSKRQRITLRLLYAIAIPSVVCLSVCRLLSVTLVHPT